MDFIMADADHEVVALDDVFCRPVWVDGCVVRGVGMPAESWLVGCVVVATNITFIMDPSLS